MKHKVFAWFVSYACVCTGVWAQPQADSKPSALNMPGAPYPCRYPDNRAMLRVVAPEAQKVRVRLGRGFDMSTGPDGLWHVVASAAVVAAAADSIPKHPATACAPGEVDEA